MTSATERPRLYLAGTIIELATAMLHLSHRLFSLGLLPRNGVRSAIRASDIVEQCGVQLARRRRRTRRPDAGRCHGDGDKPR